MGEGDDGEKTDDIKENIKKHMKSEKNIFLLVYIN